MLGCVQDTGIWGQHGLHSVDPLLGDVLSARVVLSVLRALCTWPRLPRDSQGGLAPTNGQAEGD